MSIRTALGASRWRVIRQLLIESLLLSTFGGLLGLGLAAFGVHWFDLSTAGCSALLDPFHHGLLGIRLFCGALHRERPVIRHWRPRCAPHAPISTSVLKEGARSVGHHREGWLSATLVVFQFALTLVLLTGAGMFVHSLLASLSINPSIPARQLLTARIDLPDIALQRYRCPAALLRPVDCRACAPFQESAAWLIVSVPAGTGRGAQADRTRTCARRRTGAPTVGRFPRAVAGIFRRHSRSAAQRPRFLRDGRLPSTFQRHSHPRGGRAFLAEPRPHRQALPPLTTIRTSPRNGSPWWASPPIWFRNWYRTIPARCSLYPSGRRARTPCL